MKKYFIDILILIFGIFLLITYNYEEDLAPKEWISTVILITLWGFLRLFFFILPKLKEILIYILLVWGSIEALYGIGQLHGFFDSNHHIFKITGSFLNPGPYGGFIALFLPFSLYYWLLNRKKIYILSYIFLALFIIFLLVLPATFSRTAWIAALIGCSFVFLKQEKNNFLRNNFISKNKRFIFSSFIFIPVFLICSGYLVYNIKKDSANGRVFIWKISTIAAKESIFLGEGLGSFPKKYAEAQKNYFKQNLGNEKERIVAGSPEYAFNEYLRIFIEQGTIGIILFLMISFLIIREGLKNRQYGSVGSFITLSIFAFASYPYYLWQFLLTWIILGVLCLQKENIQNKNNSNLFNLSLLLLLLISFSYFSYLQYDYYKKEKEWEKLSFLYLEKKYNTIESNYTQLYSKLHYNPKFIFEYALILNATKQYEKADKVIKRGLLVSNDPMFYNLQGRNYYEMKNFSKAEESLLNSTFLVPERIYPYFLLTKLYSDSLNYQPDKMNWAANIVLKKKPKVLSPAIEEMRSQVHFILKKNE